jgi:S-adenosylmethionine-diacylglycerol 3-amino-3-carboxypropyl transferase
MDKPVSHQAATTEVAAKAELDRILYAQCWEDADILLEGLDVRPGDVCLSVASAGDNSLSLLAGDPARVIAVDLSPAQLNCLELRVAAYRSLTHDALLELMGSRPSSRRPSLYAECRPLLGSDASQVFWDARINQIAAVGLGGVGRFERYFRLFRRFVLPLIHSAGEVRSLLEAKPPTERQLFYDTCWNNWRWRLLIRTFSSRTVMASLGRNPAFFTYIESSIAEHALNCARHAAVDLDLSANPYVAWMLTGQHGRVLPHALREENFAVIRDRLDRLEWHTCSIEAFVDRGKNAGGRIDKFNLSDIFEYMSAENADDVLSRLIDVANPGARLMFWNMLVRRVLPDELSGRVRSLDDLARDLLARDKAFLYSGLNIGEVH